jgi:hypothetical protein
VRLLPLACQVGQANGVAQDRARVVMDQCKHRVGDIGRPFAQRMPLNSQAYDEGSIPFTRSSMIKHLAQLRGRLRFSKTIS